MGVEIRAIRMDEAADFHHVMTAPFGFDITEEMAANFPKVFEAERMRGAFDGEQMVATLGAHTFDLSVPGGSLPLAGTTTVTVLPTHRRRGVMRALMNEHLHEAHRRGEPLAGLWASESNIYGRFGYGSACDRLRVEIDSAHAVAARIDGIVGQMKLIDKEEAIAALPTVYDKMFAKRPGMLSRKPRWWTSRRLADVEYQREGATKHRRVLMERNGEHVGYVVYRTTVGSSDGPQVRIVELVGLDPEAERSLWQFVFGIDLVRSIQYELAPMNSLVQWLPEKPRQIRKRFEDALWIRILDVAVALQGRRYEAPGSIRFRLRDELCGWNHGVFQLDVDSDGAGACRAVDGDSELEMDIAALGALYLGGRSFRDFAAAGMLKGNCESLTLADAMFRAYPPPWCPEIF